MSTRERLYLFWIDEGALVALLVGLAIIGAAFLGAYAVR